jgi:hypothetical protein
MFNMHTVLLPFINDGCRMDADFHMHTQRNTTGQRSLFVNGLKLFNGLPDHMKVPNLNRNLLKKKNDG